MDALDRIKELMKERAWSETQLAKEADLNPSTIQSLFTRNNSPTLQTLQSICKAFNMTLAEFFREDQEPYFVTPEQMNLLDAWNTLNEEQKEALLRLIHTMH